jgi:hypothetical protein
MQTQHVQPVDDIPPRALGGYDGVDLWTLRVWNVSSVHEQVFASLHERLHHELQSSTLWGLLTRFSDDFLRDSRYRQSARLLFWIGVLRSQLVHEVYATTLAAGMDPDYVAVLDANPEHRAHRERGLRLLGSSQSSWAHDRYLIDALLRACMNAPGLVRLAGRMPDIRAADLDAVACRPDERLERLERADLMPLRDLIETPPASVAELRDLHDRVASALPPGVLETATSDEIRGAISRSPTAPVKSWDSTSRSTRYAPTRRSTTSPRCSASESSCIRNAFPRRW